VALDPASTEPALRHAPPSAAHWLGTDALGRDLLARVLIGGRTSLLVGLAATLASVAIGVAWGGVAGLLGGAVDEALMRVVDFLYGIPYMFLVVLVMLLFADTARARRCRCSWRSTDLWLTMAHRARPGAPSPRSFVLAARAAGAGSARILFRHLPNCWPHRRLRRSWCRAYHLESTSPSSGPASALVGQLVAEGVSVVNPVRSYWWLLAFPSGFLAATLLALNFLGTACATPSMSSGGARAACSARRSGGASHGSRGEPLPAPVAGRRLRNGWRLPEPDRAADSLRRQGSRSARSSFLTAGR
jgi:oligopeptide transport system permease protein